MKRTPDNEKGTVTRIAVDSATLDLIRKYERSGPRYTSFPPANHFSESVNRQELLADMRVTPEVSLYVHIPFCETLCWFCGCHTVTTLNHRQSSGYLDLLEREIELVLPHLPESAEVVQVHLGGGTPNFLNPAEIQRLGALLRDRFRFAGDVEFSTELDPRRLTRSHVEALAEAGMNRASFGVQDTDPAVQKAIHRVQPPELNERAMGWLRDVGVGSVNVDLIYGLPLQHPDSFSRTLEHVIGLGADRFAVFNYAHVPWMRPAQKILERNPMPDGAAKLKLLGLVIETLTNAGFEYIGMDHFARPDDELVRARRAGTLQRNFQGYSTRGGAQVVGLGVSSISQTPVTYRQNVKSLDVWSSRLAEGIVPVERGFVLSHEDQLRRWVISELMCNLRLSVEAFERRWEVCFRELFGQELEALRPFEEDGLLSVDGECIRIKPMGRLFIRNIAMVFDNYLAAAPGRYSRTV